jgi:thioredoxin reductase (NADPH)
MSDYLAARIRATPNIEVHVNTEISEVHGSSHIEALTLSHRDGTADTNLPAAAVFVFIGADPYCDWLPDGIAKDDHGYLATGHDAKSSGRWPLEERDPCPLETSIPGVLAAGDVRAGATKRVGFAVGDGALAVTCTHRLRSMIEGPKVAATKERLPEPAVAAAR